MVYAPACGVSDGAKDAGRPILEAFVCGNGKGAFIPYSGLSYVNPRYSDGSETGNDCNVGMFRLLGGTELISTAPYCFGAGIVGGGW